jgi:hypothetical protein
MNGKKHGPLNIEQENKLKILNNGSWAPSKSHSFQTYPVGRPAPRSGFRVLTGLSGQFFFKSKRRRFSKKKKTKINGLQPSFFTGSHRVFLSLIFSSTWPGFSLGSTGSWVDLPGQVSKLCKIHEQIIR